MIIFDTETTGLIRNGLIDLKDQPRIIEFAAIKLDNKTLEETDRIEFMVNPQIHIPEAASKANGIFDKDVADALPFKQHFPKLVEFFFGEKYSVAHNHSYDTGMLSLELRRMKKQYQFPWPPIQICTVAQTYSMKNYRLNLTALHTHLFGQGFDQAHRAMTDVEALTRCTKELMNRGIIKL